MAHEHLYELAEEVIRLRALLVTTGRTSDEKETRRLERLDSLEEENTHLRRKLHRLECKVADLERAQVQAESDHEISEERAFNMQRSDSPHATAHPISISPRMGRRQVGRPLLWAALGLFLSFELLFLSSAVEDFFFFSSFSFFFDSSSGSLVTLLHPPQVPPPATVSPVSSSPLYGIVRPVMARHHPHAHPRHIDDIRARSGSDVST